MDGLAALTSYSVDFDSTLEDYVLTLVGAGFGATAGDNTEFTIDGMDQVILSANDTVLEVQITSMFDSSSLNIDFYLPIGIPEGTDDLMYNVGITLTPQFLSITPNTGSPAGTLITASVKGVGNMTQNVTLITADGTNLCQSVVIPSYGIVECITLAATIADNTLQVAVNGTNYTCLGSNGECDYQTSSSMPVVSNIAQQDAYTLVFTGVGFSFTGFPASVTYLSILADQVSVDTNTQVTAIFINGVPLSQSA